MNFLSAPWLWMYTGALLMLVELFAPGFILFFFGLAAATVGCYLFFAPGAFLPGLAGQLAIFSLFSVAYLLTLRRYAKSIFGGDVDSAAVNDGLVGRIARVVEPVSPERPGRILLGDAEWAASAAVALPIGVDVKVCARKNLTLEVEPI